MFSIIDINNENAQVWVEMARRLWPDYNAKDLQQILFRNLKSPNHKHWLCVNSAGEVIGFIDLSLRHDYVEGCSTTPVGYIEGLYVRPEHRKGIHSCDVNGSSQIE